MNDKPKWLIVAIRKFSDRIHVEFMQSHVGETYSAVWLAENRIWTSLMDHVLESLNASDKAMLLAAQIEVTR